MGDVKSIVSDLFVGARQFILSSHVFSILSINQKTAQLWNKFYVFIRQMAHLLYLLLKTRKSCFKQPDSDAVLFISRT